MAITRLRRPAHRTSPCRLDIADLHAPVINAFLGQIERERGNTIRSCNARLAAIHPVQLRSPAPPRARRRHRPGYWPSCLSGRSDNRHVPHQHRDRGPARRPGPGHPHRSPRPRLDPIRSPDRAAALRAHRPDPLGCPPRHRPLRRLPWQGLQRPHHPADSGHGHHPARSPNTPGHQTTRCSPPSAAGSCPTTPCSSAWPSTRLKQPARALSWASNNLTPTSCAIM